MKKRTRRLIFFLFTMLFVCGTIVAVVALAFGRGGNLGGGIQLAAPKDLQGLALSVYLNFRASDLTTPAGTNTDPITFTIESGEGLNSIGNRLQSAKLVKDPDLFKRYLQYNGLDAGIEAGNFVLNQAMTIPQIGKVLQEGRIEELTVTIPEGKRIEEVAEIAASQAPISATEFLKLAQNPIPWKAQYPFLNDLPADATLEGYLFPDTYRLPKDKVSAKDLINRMLSNFDKKVTPQMRADVQAAGRTLWDVIRLASIVEREAAVAGERPRIAGVYLNRLSDGVALDADPTIQYALGQSRSPGTWWFIGLTQDDYHSVVSPYNTYLNPGLPPGPIANPGLSSIEAAIHPEKHDYYYFRASCAQDGTHRFARTLEEQAANECK